MVALALASGALLSGGIQIFFGWTLIADIFRDGADPTATLSHATTLLTYASGFSAVLLGGQAWAMAGRGDGSLSGLPIPLRVALISSAVGPIALIPCLLPAAGALCGVYYVVVSQLAMPLILLCHLVLAVRLGKGRFRTVSIALAAGLALSGAAARAWITPKSAEDCARLEEPSLCYRNVAIRRRDESLCLKADWRSTRWECLYVVAEVKKAPRICERIEPSGEGVDAAEALEYRDHCYFLVAQAASDRALCGRISDANTRQRCSEP